MIITVFNNLLSGKKLSSVFFINLNDFCDVEVEYNEGLETICGLSKTLIKTCKDFECNVQQNRDQSFHIMLSFSINLILTRFDNFNFISNNRLFLGL